MREVARRVRSSIEKLTIPRNSVSIMDINFSHGGVIGHQDIYISEGWQLSRVTRSTLTGNGQRERH